MKYLTVNLITFYQLFLSFIFIGACRYSPTCSQYTKKAILNYGVLTGAWLGIKRLWSCK